MAGQSRPGGSGSAALAVLALVALMWLLELVDQVLPVYLDQYGIVPRTGTGLIGIPLSPLLHADFAHLMSNTVPFLVLGLLVAWRSGPAFWRVLLTITLVGGLGVWVFGASQVVTVGASGVIFGFLSYLIVAGIISRHIVDILISVAVLFLYGGLLLGVTPVGVSAGISWLAHLTGAAAGVAAALWFAPRPARSPAAA